VDEEEWFSSVDARAMLAFLEGKVSDRKLRLFACACARSRQADQGDGRCRRALEVAEGHADGQASDAELEAAYRATPPGPVGALASAAAMPGAGIAAYWVVSLLSRMAAAAVRKRKRRTGQAALRPACLLLRELFGNPFQPLPPRSFPAHVVGLAQSIYAAFPAISPEYAILADALEEMGETEAAAHCRLELHAKGCHVIDLLLGKG
jgi:hypothetical protein